MASKTFLPRALPRSKSILAQRQCRNLSSTSRLFLPASAGQENASAMRSMVQKSAAGQSSIKSQMSKMKKSDIPTDFGLLPNILVKPKWKDLPPLLSSKWKRRLRIEWMSIRQRVVNFMRLIFSAKWQVPKDSITRKKKRRPLLLRERAEAVEKLYTELGKAIANRNKSRLDIIACTGLKSQLRIRFDRMEATKQKPENWKVEYLGWIPKKKTPWIFQALCPPNFKAIRIIYDCEAQFPLDELMFVRQVIAKIKTRQTLERGREYSQTVEREEYVVIQKILVEGVNSEWMIWGTTEPATTEEIDKLLEEGASDTTFKDNFNQYFQKWSGNAPPM